MTWPEKPAWMISRDWIDLHEPSEHMTVDLLALS